MAAANRAGGSRILTLFLVPVWCLLVIFGLLIGRRLGMLATGGKRVCRDSGRPSGARSGSGAQWGDVVVVRFREARPQ